MDARDEVDATRARAETPTLLNLTIELVAGRGVQGHLGDAGAAVLAQLDAPTGVAVDAAEGILVVDASNRVRRIAFGIITTVVGSGAATRVEEFETSAGDGGPATDAQLSGPIGVAVDGQDAILVTDTLNGRIRRVTPDGTITTIAGGGFRAPWDDDGVPATEATLNHPDGVAIDHDGNVYIADTFNHRVRRVDPGGTITTIAGSRYGDDGFAGDGGPATEALLNRPTGVVVSRRGDVFIADEYNHRIRRVGPHGQISTVAGTGFAWFGGDGGPAIDAFLNYPTELLLDGDDRLLIADSSNLRVRMVDRDGTITTIAGGGSQPPADGVPATSVSLGGAPTGMSFDGEGRVLGCEERGHRVWRLTPVDP
jgi:sugar lactone lactonase YvrE